MQKELSLKRNMLWNSAGSLFSLVCQWLTTVLVVRLSHGYDAAGALTLAMTISNVFQPLAVYSMRSYQVSDTERATSAGEYVAFRIATIVLAFVTSALYAVLATGRSVFPVIVLYLLYKGIDVFIDVLHGVDQQHSRMDYCGKSMALRGALSLCAFCLGLGLFNSLEVAIALMCAITLPVVFLDWRAASQFDDLTPHLSVKKFFALAGTCLPAVLGIACCTAVISVARQKLGMLEGQSALGIYASVCTPVVVVQSCIRYIYAPLLVTFASKLNRGDYSGYRILFLKVTCAFVIVSVLGIAGFKLLGSLFLDIVFGPEVAELSYLLDLAVLSTALCAFVSFLSDQLIASRRLWSVLWSNAIGLVISAGASQYFIETLGLNGTSLVVVVAYVVTAIAQIGFLFYRMDGGVASNC